MEDIYRIHYFDLIGRGGSIKCLLKTANQPYEFVCMPFKAWPTSKTQYSFGNLPCVEINGEMHSQTLAILVKLGIKFGFYPTHAMEIYEVHWFYESMEDIAKHYVEFAYFATDLEEKERLAAIFITQTIPLFVTQFEKKLKNKENQEFLVGSKLTIADFYVFTMFLYIFTLRASEHCDRIRGSVKEHSPTLYKYLRKKQKEEYPVMKGVIIQSKKEPPN